MNTQRLVNTNLQSVIIYYEQNWEPIRISFITIYTKEWEELDEKLQNTN